MYRLDNVIDFSNCQKMNGVIDVNKILTSLFLIFSIFILNSAVALAEALPTTTSTKPTIAILPLLDNSGFKKSEDVIAMVKDALNKKFTNDKYNILAPQLVEGGMKKAGITDLNATERSDLILLGKNINADYVILVELPPINVVHSQSLFSIQYEATASLKVKIVDVAQAKYAFSKTYTAKNKNQAVLVGNVGTVAPVKAAIAQDIDEFNAEADIGIKI
jgi:hypothetical protein